MTENTTNLTKNITTWLKIKQILHEIQQIW
jgi:hypothetical protein